MLDGLSGDNATSVETVSSTENSAIQTETSNEGVSSSFLDAVTKYKEESGLVKTKTPETVVEPKEEIKLEQPKTEEEEKAVKADTIEENSKEEELQSPEGEPVKATRIAEVKEWGKKWQNTAQEREPAFELVQNRFGGNLEEAEISANMFDLLFSNSVEEFDPNKVFSELASMSKPRAEKLIRFFADNETVQNQAQSKVMEKLFGTEISQDELAEELEGYKLFKEVGGISSLLDEDGELPDNLKYDLEGNPRTEDEMNLFKSVLSELKSLKSERLTEAQNKANQEKTERQKLQEESIRNYTEERFGTVNTALDNLELKVNPSDSDEIKSQKARDSRMIRAYVTVAVTEDDNFSKVYSEAVDALKNGDSFTANRLKTKLNKIVADYTSEIVDDYIAKNNIKSKQTKEQIDRAKDLRKEVALGSGDFTAHSQRKQNESIEESITRLINEGKLDRSKFNR